MTSAMHYCKRCKKMTPHFYGVICEPCAILDDARIDKWLQELREAHREGADETEEQKPETD